jgi:hypothetical protein
VCACSSVIFIDACELSNPGMGWNNWHQSRVQVQALGPCPGDRVGAKGSRTIGFHRYGELAGRRLHCQGGRGCATSGSRSERGLVRRLAAAAPSRHSRK